MRNNTCVSPWALLLFLVVFVIIMCVFRKWIDQQLEYYENMPKLVFPKVYADLYGGASVKATFPKAIDLKKLKELSNNNATSLFLYRVLLGNGNNANARLPSHGLLFCLYKPTMFQGVNDVRPLIREMKTSSCKLKPMIKLLLTYMDSLDEYYRLNGITNPCNRMNVQTHQVEPIIHLSHLVAAACADLIPYAASGEIEI